mgnify:CR=1 FL=1
MKCKLEDIVDVTMGQSPKSEYYNTEGNGVPFLQGNRTFGFKRPTFDTYTTLVTKSAKAGDIIMSVRAPVGDLNITPVDMCLGRGVCSLRMKNGNQEFLYYMMKYYMPQLLNKESGTVFGSVNRNDINGLEVDIPENTDIQRKIARYLTMIDDKIELNNEINNNLLEQVLTNILIFPLVKLLREKSHNGLALTQKMLLGYLFPIWVLVVYTLAKALSNSQEKLLTAIMLKSYPIIPFCLASN